MAASIAESLDVEFDTVWTGRPGQMGEIERVVGPLTGHSFYMARVVTQEGQALTLFASTAVEIEHKIRNATRGVIRYRTRVGSVVVEGETWAQFRARLSEVVNHG